MSNILHIYKRPDVDEVFVYAGGAYIEVFDNADMFHASFVDGMIGWFPEHLINVWNYRDDRCRMHLEQNGPNDDSDFEAYCVDWLVDHGVLPFFCRVDEIDVDDMIDAEVERIPSHDAYERV